jgi:hypothetical protein
LEAAAPAGLCPECLEKEPHRRYASARDVAEDRGRLLRHQPVVARPSTLTRKSVLWFRRRPWILAGAVSALAIALVWLSYAFWVENKDLMWQQTHPNEIRPGGWLTKEPGWDIFIIIFQAALFLPWAKPFYRKRRERVLSGRRVSSSLLGGYALLSLLGMGLSVYLGIMMIDFYRWDNQEPLRLQRQADYQKWQDLKQQHPEWPFAEPKLKGFSRFGLGAFFIMAFSGVWCSASLLRKVIHEYLFVMFPSPEQEQDSRLQALRDKQSEALSFARFVGRPHTMLRFTAIWCLLGTGVVTTFALSAALKNDAIDYLLVPVSLVFGWALALAVALGQAPQTRAWLLARILAAVASLAATITLLAHYDRGMILTGLVLGGPCGIAHGVALRHILWRCQRWTRRENQTTVNSSAC